MPSEELRKIEKLQKEVTKNTMDVALLTQKMDVTNTTMEKLCVTIADDTKETRKALASFDEAMRGKDTENPGLLVRMALLEQYAKRMKQVVSTIVATISSAGIAFLVWVLGVFGHKH